MPCQHLAQIQQLRLPMSDSDVLKVICPVCGQIDVCAYTPLTIDENGDDDAVKPRSAASANASSSGPQPGPPQQSNLY